MTSSRFGTRYLRPSLDGCVCFVVFDMLELTPHNRNQSAGGLVFIGLALSESSPVRSLSLSSLSLVNASRIPAQASRSTRSSCNPRPPSSTDAFVAVGRPTPRDGGTKPGGGALMAEGAMRDCRMCASDDLMAMCIP